MPDEARFCSKCGAPINAAHIKRPENTGATPPSNTPLNSNAAENTKNTAWAGASASSDAGTSNTGNGPETMAGTAGMLTLAEKLKGRLPIIAAVAAVLLIIICFAVFRGSSRNDRERPASTYSSEKADTGASYGEESDTDIYDDSEEDVDDYDDEDDYDDSDFDMADDDANTVEIQKTLVAETLESDPLNISVTPDSIYIQDLVDFCGGALSYEPLSTSKDYNVRNFSGTASDKAVLEAYVRTVCDGNYNLELVDEYEKSYSDTYFSWNINYTGSGNVTATMDGTFTDTVCTIEIYGTIERNKMKAAVWIPQQMEQIDLGLRYGGQNEDVHIAGESAMTGLYKLSDGSFETADGRFSTGLGQAMVMRDGTPYITEATFNRDSKLSRDELWVENFYRDEMLFFCAPENRLLTGDVYTLKDLIQEDDWVNKTPSVFDDADTFAAYRWTLFFGMGHDGDFITPLLADYSEFKELTVRVMYLDKDVEAVYYIYAELKSEPYTIEALCAVDLNGGKAAVQADDKYTMYVGETLDVSCPKAFVPNYELFTWEITEGASLAELSGTKSPSCTLKAKKAGTVRVKVTYEYGIDEPDVLTGNLRNENKTKTYEYLITIQSK